MTEDDRELLDKVRLEAHRLARGDERTLDAARRNGLAVVRAAFLRGVLVGSALTTLVLLGVVTYC